MSVSSKPSPRSRRATLLTTSSVVSFSLTLLVASVLVGSGLVPLHQISLGARIDVVALLLMTPVVALILGIVFEVTRIALVSPDLPDTRVRQTIRWSPSHRRG